MPYAWQTATGPQRLTIREIHELHPAYSRTFIGSALARGAGCLDDLREHERHAAASRAQRKRGYGISIAPRGQFRHRVEQRVPWHREGLT